MQFKNNDKKFREYTNRIFSLQKKYYGNPQPLFKNNYIPMRKILAGIMRTYGRKIVGNFVTSSLLLLIRNLQ